VVSRATQTQTQYSPLNTQRLTLNAQSFFGAGICSPKHAAIPVPSAIKYSCSLGRLPVINGTNNTANAATKKTCKCCHTGANEFQYVFIKFLTDPSTRPTGLRVKIRSRILLHSQPHPFNVRASRGNVGRNLFLPIANVLSSRITSG